MCFTGPNGGHQFRTLGLSQRPFLETPFTNHLRDLESYRRKAPLTAISPVSNHHTSSSNGLTNSTDCQGYKPNAPQIQGRRFSYFLFSFLCIFGQFLSHKLW